MRSDRCLLPLLAGVVLLLGCAADGAPLERSDLAADPAARIAMPGADELGHFADERRSTIEGTQHPFESRVYGTSATAEEVFAFYHRELMARGWVPDQPFGRMTTELSVRLWCRSKMEFRLGIQNKARAFPSSFYRGRDYVTVFDARLVGTDPTAACPVGASPSAR